MKLTRVTGAVVQGCAAYYCWIVHTVLGVSNRWSGIQGGTVGGKWDGMMGVANSCNWYCCSRLCWLLCV